MWGQVPSCSFLRSESIPLSSDLLIPSSAGSTCALSVSRWPGVSDAPFSLLLRAYPEAETWGPWGFSLLSVVPLLPRADLSQSSALVAWALGPVLTSGPCQWPLSAFFRDR